MIKLHYTDILILYKRNVKVSIDGNVKKNQQCNEQQY